MARKELTFSGAISPADLKPGDTVEGIYLGSREIPMVGRDAPGPIIELQGKHAPVSLWASTSLRGVISQLKTGTRYAFEYKGQEVNPNTKRRFHAFRIFEDDGLEEAQGVVPGR